MALKICRDCFVDYHLLKPRSFRFRSLWHDRKSACPNLRRLHRHRHGDCCFLKGGLEAHGHCHHLQTSCLPFPDSICGDVSFGLLDLLFFRDNRDYVFSIDRVSRTCTHKTSKKTNRKQDTL